MPTRLALVIAHCLLIPCLLRGADSWPQFRGPSGDGIAQDQKIPTEFSESDGVTWKTDLPGLAWSSPVVSDGTIWVTTAIERVPTEAEKVELFKKNGIEERKFKQLSIAKSIDLKLIAVSLKNGSIQNTIDLTSIESPDAIHSLNSYASPTPVIDDKHIYCHFGTYGTFCVDRSTGKIVWQRRLPLVHSVGPGSSPFLLKNMLILIQDGVERQYVTALEKSTGATLWEVDRPEMVAPTGDQKKAYSTPIAITDKAGREQLICMASQWMVAYSPATGKEIWKVYHGKGFSVVPRPVFLDDTVYFSTGFGKPQLWAVKVDGSGDVTDTHVAWTVKQGIPAKPSPLIHDGLIYVVSDNGVASSFDTKTGDAVWKERIGGAYSASPVLAGNKLYFGSHEGKVTVIQPGVEPKIMAENQLDGKIMASPAIVDNSIILRMDKALYRID